MPHRPALRWSGPSLAQRGDWQAALRSARRRLKRLPGDLGALEVMARSLVAVGRAEEALPHLRTLVRQNPHEPAYDVWRASALQAQGRYVEALLSLSRAYNLYREGPIKDKVLAEVELMINLLEQRGHQPMVLWTEVGILPPARRKGCREAVPLIH
ncbi:MAG: tetratricopeptide repeat protein [Chthonomonas sp.]|nr:tetratricopeptide repeat protein [Chthonomonas sp.]